MRSVGDTPKKVVDPTDFSVLLSGTGEPLRKADAHLCGLPGIRLHRADAAGDYALPDHIVFALNPEHVEEYLPAIASIRASQPFSELLVVLDPYTDCHACMAFRAGATDVLHMDALQRAFGRRPARASSKLEDICKSDGMPAMERWIGNSAHARHIRAWLPRVAATDCNVLITGETGSGKELIAELVHASSHRFHAKLISINCAAIPDSLLESELFGHERGAFTGANSPREGAFEAANGGTIFLDEIGEMNALAQAKILRVLETHQVQRIGSHCPKQLDLRVVAATNQPLESLVEHGQFRKDLLYRLKVVQVELPPLRARREDIPALLKHFVSVFNRKYGGRINSFSIEAMRYLLAYDWPGNIRELRNVVEYLQIEPHRTRIQLHDLPLTMTSTSTCDHRQQLMETLASVQWNKSAAARMLKWSRMTLYRKMAKYSIPENEPGSHSNHLR